MRGIRVLLADDNDDFLDVVSDWLTADAGVVIVGTARSGTEVLEGVRGLAPDVVVMNARQVHNHQPAGGFRRGIRAEDSGQNRLLHRGFTI